MTSDELKKLLDAGAPNIAEYDQGYRDAVELLWPLVEALEFYGDEKVNYYMRNDSLDENGKEDGFVNWTDREVDRGGKARQAFTDLEQKLKGG